MWQYPVQTAKKSSSRWGSTCSRWNPAGNEVCDTIPEYFRFSCNRTDLLFVTREGSKERHVMTVVLTRCDDMLSGCGLRDGCCYRRTANGVGNCRRQIFLLLLVECLGIMQLTEGGVTWQLLVERVKLKWNKENALPVLERRNRA